jgi:hypothetical protein
MQFSFDGGRIFFDEGRIDRWPMQERKHDAQKRSNLCSMPLPVGIKRRLAKL